MSRSISIGSGSAWSDDRLDWAAELADSGLVTYMGFDCLAERTMALAQVRRLNDETAGQDQRIPELMQRFSPFLSRGGKMVGNFGAANSTAAADDVLRGLFENDLSGIRIGVIHGDDVLDHVLDQDLELPELGVTARDMANQVVSANAYIGAEPIVELLDEGAQFVLGGRIADPSLYVGPIAYEMGWDLDDWAKMGTATMVAHLLECGTHATGGNYVDPPFRVLDLVHLGFPLAHVSEEELIITKLDGTGGAVDTGTMKTQLAYEIHDPTAYLTPDSTADFSQVEIEEIGPDRVRVSGANGRERPDNLKVLVGVDQGWKVVTEVSYGGPGCVDRAQLGADIVAKRLEPFAGSIDEVLYEMHGLNALFGDRLGADNPNEVRLRIAARCDDKATADRVAFESQYLWQGPAGAGGIATQMAPAIGVTPALLPRDDVKIVTEVIDA
ncbi:MAG: acyclic terpene utilization AtuA family protein [Acidimicrobiales bacterium]